MDLTNDIDNILTLLETNQLEGDDGAYKKFQLYLESLPINNFDSEKWLPEWREAIYKFGEFFQNKPLYKFLEIIENFINKNNQSHEAGEFIQSEIKTNIYNNNTKYLLEYFQNLTHKYPGNPEFHHTYSQHLTLNKEHTKAILECKIAHNIEKNNYIFIDTCFNEDATYFNELLYKENFQKAEKQVEKMQNDTSYSQKHVYKNITTSFRDRLRDFKKINEKINDLRDIVNTETEKTKIELIQILGVFAAILGFIFININIAIEIAKLNEMLWLMLGMADILLIFVISLSYIFEIDKKNFYKSGKFWVLIALLIALSCGAIFT